MAPHFGSMTRPAIRSRTATIASIVLLAVVLASLVAPISLSRVSPLGLAFLEVLRFPAFLLVTLAVGRLVERTERGRGKSAPRTAWVAALVAAVVAFATEAARHWSGRAAGASDLVLDLLGVAIGAGALAAWSDGRPNWGRVLHAVLSIVVTVAVLRVPVSAVGWREQRFPMLGDFESRVDLVYWMPFGDVEADSARIRRTREWSRSGRRSLQVTTSKTPWSGVRFVAGELPAKSTDELVIEVRNEGPPFLLGLSVDLADGRTIREAHPLSHREDTVIRVRLEPKRSPEATGVGDPVGIAEVVLHTGPEGGAREFLVDAVRVASAGGARGR